MDNSSHAGLHCFHDCSWQNSRGKCKPDVQRNTLLVRKERKQAPHRQCSQPLPGWGCVKRRRRPPSLLQLLLGSLLLPGTLQAGETYGNEILLLLGKQGALGLRNEPRA